MNSCMETCVALSILCLNIALPCSPLNAFETWADQQELSKEARYKYAFSTRRRISLLESSMLLKKLMEARNQKNCKGSWPHSLSTAQFVVLFFTPRIVALRLGTLGPFNLPYRLYITPQEWLRARKISIYFGGAGLMRECETKIFFWGCGLDPSLYGIWWFPCYISRLCTHHLYVCLDGSGLPYKYASHSCLP